MTVFHCPVDSYNRLGVWFGPEPESDTSDSTAPAGSLSLLDSVADPERVEEFVGYFRFCPN